MQTNLKPRKQQPFAALTYRDYRLLWIGQNVSQIGTQMRLAAIGWQVYVLTHDPLQLGTLALCRVVPLIACSLLGGSVADALDRRRLLLVAETVLMICSLALTLITISGAVTVWWIYGIIIVSSVVNSFERPAYSAMIPSLVPREHLAGALSLGTLGWQASMVLGPGLGGLAIASTGVAGVYLIDTFSYLAVIAALWQIRYRPDKERSTSKISLDSAVEGLRFVFSNRILVASMLLDFFATFFAAATTLLPIVATEVLKAGEVGFGVLSAAESLGAVSMSFLMAWVSVNQIRKPGILLLVAVFFYSLFTIMFGLSDNFILSFIFLALVGASDTVSMVLRQTIAQLVTPDEMRGRMQAVNMIFFAGGPQLGEMESGLVARLAGVRFTLVSGGIACAIIVLGIGTFSQRLRDYQWEDMQK